MEESLLGGGGESSSSSSSRRQIPHVRFRRRSDAIAYGSAYQRAAALVDLVSIPLPHLLLARFFFLVTEMVFWSFII